ncbi:MAG: hypothetical protein WC080_01145 [Patescibacteria group bacterium]
MKSKGLSMTAIVLSVIAAVLALLDALGVGVWLSASSWLIVAVVFGVWAIYTKE